MITNELASHIEAQLARIANLRGLVADRRAAAEAIARAISTAQAEGAAAVTGMGQLLAREAVGEAVDADAITEARARVAAAGKTAAAAQKRQAEVGEHEATAAALEARLVTENATYSALLSEQSKARADAAELALREACAQYDASGRETVRLLARVAALQAHVRDDHGRNVQVLPLDWRSAHMPGLVNTSVAPAQDFGATITTERAAAVGQFGITHRDAANFVPPVQVGRAVRPPAFRP